MRGKTLNIEAVNDSGGVVLEAPLCNFVPLRAPVRTESRGCAGCLTQGRCLWARVRG